MRLSELHQLGYVDRFRLRRTGTAEPWCWVLGPLGASLVAAERGVEVPDLPWRRGLTHELAGNERLAHLVGTNGFFSALIRSARQRAGCELQAWWSERRCAAEWGELVRPDGYGVWAERDATLPFLLEYDRGTEPLARLTAKLPGYAALASAAGHANWVLFRFGGPGREAAARRALAGSPVPVATAALRPGDAPDEAVWLPVGSSGPRRRLIELAWL